MVLLMLSMHLTIIWVQQLPTAGIPVSLMPHVWAARAGHWGREQTTIIIMGEVSPFQRLQINFWFLWMPGGCSAKPTNLAPLAGCHLHLSPIQAPKLLLCSHPAAGLKHFVKNSKTLWKAWLHWESDQQAPLQCWIMKAAKKLNPPLPFDKENQHRNVGQKMLLPAPLRKGVANTPPGDASNAL